MTEHLLIPIDLSYPSSWKKALPHAFAMAKATDAQLTVMTVIPEIMGGLDWRYSIRGETGGSEDFNVEEILQQARAKLEEIGREHAPAGMTFEVIARYGTVYDEILNLAEELPASQIVMAAHRKSMADYMIGSTTARVVRHATCSVQVVRE
ncbi:universal stress protein [Parasulfitobacter algicola]|uniref:Universal stress protein n=1 Tax=Parasulfitobacter algicola TaxID=2614809 RepID=A0ABX2IS24_9RHOB|nr:universal stress protein [Sulfitobacter algicola]NSX55699.1 universal stress protein [Sulfitobacter algicola]